MTNREVMFANAQCLKESFIKAEGSGLSYGLQNLEFVAGAEWPPKDVRYKSECCMPVVCTR